MAKDNQQGGTIYKVLVKPTDVGLLVNNRMQRPHVDKSAELRRFIELGYAAEQAGFILDGTVLRHGGRTWDIQPNFSEQAREGISPSPAQRAAVPVARPSSTSETNGNGPAAQNEGGGHPLPSPLASDTNETTGSPLRRNLRGLSK